MRRYRLLGASELRHAEATARVAVQAWADAWLGPAPLTLRAVPASEAAMTTRPWQTVAEGAGVCVHAATLAAAVFGQAQRQKPSALAAEVAETARADLLARLLGRPVAGTLQPQPPPAAHLAHASGALLLDISLDGNAVQVLLDPDTVARLLAGRPRPPRPAAPLHPLGLAVVAGRVRLSASVGAIELDVSTLQGLSPGDILPLDLPVDRPLRLSVGGQPVRRGAWLGSRQGQRALLVTALSESSEAPRHVP